MIIVVLVSMCSLVLFGGWGKSFRVRGSGSIIDEDARETAEFSPTSVVEIRR